MSKYGNILEIGDIVTIIIDNEDWGVGYVSGKEYIVATINKKAGSFTTTHRRNWPIHMKQIASLKKAIK